MPVLAPPPAPAPVPVPAAPALAPAPHGPVLALRAATSSLAVARRRGVTLKIDLAGAAVVKAWVILPGGPATQVATGTDAADPVTLARTSERRPASGPVALKLAFDGPAQEALLRFLRVTVTARIVAVDGAGNQTTVEQPITLDS